MSRKVYVDVLIKQDKEGRITPLAVTWEDGEIYEIDKVTGVCKAASLKAGVCAWAVWNCGQTNPTWELWLKLSPVAHRSTPKAAS